MAFKKSKLNISKKRITFYWIAGLGFFLKWWLVSGQEIEPIFRPADESLYILLAKNWYWWAEYDGWSFLRPPIYPLFISLVNLTGIPLIIAQEILYCSCAFYMMNCFRKNGLNSVLAGIALLMIFFHPTGILLVSHTAREILYVCLFMVFFGQLLRLSLKVNTIQDWYISLSAGLTMAALWYIREETILISLLFVAFVILYAIYNKELALWRIWGKQAAYLLLGFLVPLLILNTALRTVNYAVFGSFVTYGMNDKGFRGAYRNILRIKPEVTKPFVAVEKDSVLKAIEASSTLKSIEPYLLQKHLDWSRVTQGMAKDPQEVGGSLFLMALREAAMNSGYHSSETRAHAFYTAVADELDAAFDSNTIESRFVFNDFLDAEYSDYLKRFPGKLWEKTSLAFRPLHKAQYRIYYPKYHSVEYLDLYDEIANRRHYLAYRWAPKVKGWAFFEGEELFSATSAEYDGTVIDVTYEFHNRDDVQRVFKKQNAPLKSGFSINIPKADYPRMGISVLFKTVSGKEIKVPARLFLERKNRKFKLSDGTWFYTCIDEVISGRKDFKNQDWVLDQFYLQNGKLYTTFLAVTIALLFTRFLFFKPLPSENGNIRMILLTGLIVFSRIGFIALISASSFDPTLRSIFPAIIFIPLLFALLCQHAIAGIKKNRYRWKRE